MYFRLGSLVVPGALGACGPSESPFTRERQGSRLRIRLVGDEAGSFRPQRGRPPVEREKVS